MPKFFIRKKMENQDVKTDSQEQEEVHTNENETTTTKEQSGNACSSCGGTGLENYATLGNSATNLCSVCKGSGTI